MLLAFCLNISKTIQFKSLNQLLVKLKFRNRKQLPNFLLKKHLFPTVFVMRIRLQLEDKENQKKKKRVEQDGVTEDLDQTLELSLPLPFLTVIFPEIKSHQAIDRV